MLEQGAVVTDMIVFVTIVVVVGAILFLLNTSEDTQMLCGDSQRVQVFIAPQSFIVHSFE